MTLRRYPYAGKFEGGLLIDEHVYAASLDGCGETVGDDNGGESYTSVDGPLTDINPTDEHGTPLLNTHELAFLASQAGAIVHESSDGFVDVSYYADEDSYLVAWNHVVDSYADDEETDDTDDYDGPLFSVVEHSSYFAVRHNPSGREEPMSDGVDVLFDDEENPISPGTEGFVEKWADALNASASETLEAYFPDLADDED